MALNEIFGPNIGYDFLPVNTVQNTALYYIMNSTLAGSTDFKYNFQLSIKGQNYIYKVPPRPVTGYGEISFSNIVKSFISLDLLPTVGDRYVRATNSYVCYDVTVTEEWNPGKTFSDTQNVGGYLCFTFSTPHGFNTTDLLTVQMDDPYLNPQYNGTCSVIGVPNPYLVQVNKPFGASTYLESGTITNIIAYSGTFTEAPQCAWNGNRQYLDGNEQANGFINYTRKTSWTSKFLSTYDNYIINPTNYPENYIFVSKKPVFCLSDYSTPESYPIDQYESLSWIDHTPYSSTYYSQLKIRTISTTGSVNEFTVSAGSTASAWGGQMFVAGVGPQQWNGNYYAPVIITANTKEYYICLLNQVGTRVSEWRAYEIVCNCSPWNNFRIYFQNSLGAMDYWNFNYLSTNTFDINRTEFKKTLNWNYDIGDRGASILSQAVQENIYVSSDWIDEAQSRYLKELIYSPEVYWLKDLGGGQVQMVPLVIQTNSYEIKTNLKDRLFCISFSAKMAYQQSTQNQ